MTGLETFNKIKAALEKKYGEEVKRICLKDNEDNEILELETIEKELKALEIILKHGLSINHADLIPKTDDYEMYRRIITSHHDVFKYETPYSQQEYDLLKEVLLWYIDRLLLLKIMQIV